jgi:hypothetical protein
LEGVVGDPTDFSQTYSYTHVRSFICASCYRNVGENLVSRTRAGHQWKPGAINIHCCYSDNIAITTRTYEGTYMSVTVSLTKICRISLAILYWYVAATPNINRIRNRMCLENATFLVCKRHFIYIVVIQIIVKSFFHIFRLE